MAELYSLSSVTVVIKNSTYGNITLSGGANRDEIELRRSNEGFTKEDSADGNSVFSHNASKAGECDITIRQTSRLAKELQDFFNFCQANPLAAVSSIEVKDTLGVVDSSMENALPSNLASNKLGQTAGSRMFSFISESLDMQ